MVSAAALMVSLAACDGGSNGGETTTTKQMRPANEFADRLRSLSEFNRGLALRRAVQDTGQPCKRAVASASQEDYKNLSVWTLRCTDGEYALFIAPNADVQVRTCADVATLGLPECRLPEAAAEEKAGT